MGLFLLIHSENCKQLYTDVIDKILLNLTFIVLSLTFICFVQLENINISDDSREKLNLTLR